MIQLQLRQRLLILALFLLALEASVAFTATLVCRNGNALSSPTFTQLRSSGTDEAAAITEFMARAHEEKIAAIGRVEAKYREQVAELQQQVSELETQASKTTPTSGNSFAFPATNKELTSKVEAYRTFISDYIIKAQQEKQNAVKDAEEKLKAKYEAIIADLKERE